MNAKGSLLCSQEFITCSCPVSSEFSCILTHCFVTSISHINTCHFDIASSVGIVTRLLAIHQGIMAQFLARVEIFLFFYMSRQAQGPPSFYPKDTGAFCPERSDLGVQLITHLHLVPMSRMYSARSSLHCLYLYEAMCLMWYMKLDHQCLYVLHCPLS
jgi:hypothetical protein